MSSDHDLELDSPDSFSDEPETNTNTDKSSHDKQSLWRGFTCRTTAIAVTGIALIVLSIIVIGGGSETHICLVPQNATYFKSIVESTTPNPSLLDDCWTPQGRAFQWLALQEAHLTMSKQRVLNRYALAVLYFSTSGQDWFEQYWFLHEGFHECKWFGDDCGSTSGWNCGNAPAGITCDDVGDVVRIQLTRNDLKGTIPEEITILQKLTSLKLHSNELSSTIPSGIFLLPNLNTLDLSDNELSGHVPTLVSDDSSMNSLSLHRNQLKGSVPEAIGQMTNLGSLLLGRNAITGTIPSFLGNLTALNTIDLSENDLHGTIPSELQGIGWLQSLLLEDNRLSGTFPLEFTGSRYMGAVHVHGNQLTGNVNSLCKREKDLSSLIVDCAVECRCCDTIGVHGESDCMHMFDHTTSCKVNITADVSTLEVEMAHYRAIVEKTTENLAVLDDPSSPQYNSLLWLAGFHSDHAELSDKRILARYALAVLYFSTHGCTWREPELFLQKDHECSWGTRKPTHEHYWHYDYPNNTMGVSCSDSETVDELFLPSVGLRGSIPQELSLLEGLRVLNFQQGELSSTIPSEILQLPSLRFLNFAWNRLSGEIVAGDAPLWQLEELDLTSNSLEGTFPWSSFAATEGAELVKLSLSRNSFSGTVAWDVMSSAMDLLETLELSMSGLQGGSDLPPTGLESIERLALSQSGLRGTFPDMIAGMGNLISLDLQSNSLTGTLPSFLGSLANVASIVVRDNKLTGRIPSELGGLENLYQLGLSENQLTGPVPTELGNMTRLDDLGLSGNQLTGSLEVFCLPQTPQNGTCDDEFEFCDDEEFYSEEDDDWEGFGGERFRIWLRTDCSNDFTCSCCKDCDESPTL